MADDRLLLVCAVCKADQPLAVLHGVQARAFLEVERLQLSIEDHLLCSGEHVLRFADETFVVRTESGMDWTDVGKTASDDIVGTPRGGSLGAPGWATRRATGGAFWFFAAVVVWAFVLAVA